MTASRRRTASSSARSSYFGFSGKENEMWDGLDVMSGNTPHWLKGERYQHFGARAYDPVTCIFMQIDPMAEKYYGMTPYHYCAANPVMMVDPDGQIVETLWDIANVVIDVKSLASSIRAGKTGAAIADGAGLILDLAAVFLPGVPAGAGAGLKTARAADKAVDAAKAVDKAGDAKHVIGNYSNIPNPRNAGPGKNVTKSQKEKILEQNKQNYGGVLRSDGDGRILNPAKKSVKGQPADMNQAEIDHVVPKSKGGTNENSNLQVLSKEENLKKSNKM